MNCPIGVFDSGLGGLTVFSSVKRLLPKENIAYLADNFHVPYGERLPEEIEEFGIGISDFFVEKGAKVLVMACNMMSAIVLDEVKKRHPALPVIGVIEPGVKAAVSVSNDKPIGILATTGTVRSGAYKKAIARWDSSIRVVQQACPKFVPLIENGEVDSEKAIKIAKEYVRPLILEGCKVIVLGCTHYPFLISEIQLAAGPEVIIVDPAEETARVLRDTLVQRHLLNDNPKTYYSFYVTGDKDQFVSLGGPFLGQPINDIFSVSWGVDLGGVYSIENTASTK